MRTLIAAFSLCSLLPATRASASSGMACPPSSLCPADLDGDGCVTCADWALFMQYWLNGDPCGDADQSGGTPDGSDIDWYLALYDAKLSCGTCFGPSNDDCPNAASIFGCGPFHFDLCLTSTSAVGRTVTCGSDANGPGAFWDSWFCWRAPTTGTYTFNPPTTFVGNYSMSIYSSGTTCGACPTNGASAISCGGPTPVVAGQYYLIQIGLNWTGMLGVVSNTAITHNTFSITPPLCKTNFNGDCEVNCDDFAAFHKAWLANSPSADYDGVGGVTPADLTAFINDYLSPSPACAHASTTSVKNDSCSTAESIPLINGVRYFDLTCANSIGPNYPKCNFTPPDGSISHDVWYSVLAGFPGTLNIRVDRLVNTWDPRISVYLAGNCGTVGDRIIACNDDTIPNAPSARVSILTRLGETYLIRVGSDNPAQFGIGSVTTQFTGAPTCPAPAANVWRQYILAGNGNGTPFTWQITSTNGSLSNFGDCCLTGTTPGLTRDQFVAKINAQAMLRGCATITAAAGGIKSFKIFNAGPDRHDLWVASGTAYPNCLVRTNVNVTFGPPCVFNPEIREQEYLGLDCNKNGIDDMEDFFNGTSLDANENDIPDECECPCAADFDSSGGTPDASDIDAFFTTWLLGDPAADADCSGGTPDASDIDTFFIQWLNGGC